MLKASNFLIEKWGASRRCDAAPSGSSRRLVNAGLLVLCCVLSSAGGRADLVVFSEVHFHPTGGKPEFVEIYNTSRTPFDLARWRLEGGVQFQFPEFSALSPQGSFLGPKERILVTGVQSSTFRSAYSIPPGVRVFGPWSGSLSDTGEGIVLRDKNGTRLCALNFDDKRGWPPAADGLGHSLVLVDANRKVDDVLNWKASALPGGSPGEPEHTLKLDSPVPIPDLEIAVSNSVTHVDYGSIWRFEVGPVAVETDWYQPSFDDGLWSRGLGLLGSESATLPAPGIRAPLNLGAQVSFYFRHTFVVPDLGTIRNTSLDLIVDDGAIVYLNGKEIGRARMPDGAVDGSTLASEAVADAVEEIGIISVPPGLLLQGANRLAVEVHQASRNSSDLVFGLRLRSALKSEPFVVFNELYMPVGSLGFVEFYNRSGEQKNLKGYSLKHNMSSPTQIPISSDLLLDARGVGIIELDRSAFPAGFTELYLIAPDGQMPVCAMKVVDPAAVGSVARHVDGESSWVRLLTPTPSKRNASGGAPIEPLRINETRFGPSGLEWVEVFNPNSFPVSADGLRLSVDRGGAHVVTLSGTVPWHGFVSVDLPVVPQSDTVILSLANQEGVVLDAARISVRAGVSMQLFPDGGSEWYATPNSTRAAPNAPRLEQRIVINEILCAPPSGEAFGEFIELYNRGTEPVDLSGWSLSGGVQFSFPVGTTLQAGGYLVVGASASALRRVYGDIPVLGDYRGRLNKLGDELRLEDGSGNRVNQLRYSAGGDWPDWANGGGSSLELTHPFADNRRASAWKDSDESAKSSFRSFSTTGVYSVLKAMGTATDYKEIHLYLVGEGHVVLDKIKLSRFGSTANLLVGANQISSTGRGDSGWLCQGTHWRSFVAKGELHLVSDDRGDSRVNKAEIDAVGMNRNDVVTLSFDAKWVAGSARLIAQTWDRSVSASFQLDRPENLGTPGRRNSRYQEHSAPQVDELLHQPAVPRSDQKVRVTARVGSVDSLARVELVHRVDSADGLGAWATKPMFDDGAGGGDEASGDGIYSGELDAAVESGKVTQFFVRASSLSGATAMLPKLGPEKPALFVVDNQKVPGDLRAERLVMSAYDLGAISDGGTAQYDFKFPRLQNHYFNATFVSEEKDIYYGASVRNTGSPWTRSQDLGRGKWKLPSDRRFRNRTKFVFDNDAEGHISHNRVTRQLLYWMGQPINEQEFVNLAINAGPFLMKEETDPIDNEYLDRHFENGAEGDLYRLDDEWWFTDAGQQDYRNADWLYKFTENAGLYRTEYMKRTNEEDDDYRALIHFFKVVSGNHTQEQIERLVDPEAILKMAAVRGYVADWDFFSMNRGKNAWFYRRPVDGRFQFLHWDSDQAFGDVTRTFQAGVPGYDSWAREPYNVRRFNTYLAELMERFSRHSPRFAAWIQAEEQASTAYTANAAFYKQWFDERYPHALRALGTNYGRLLQVFPVTTGGGAIEADAITLRGTAPYGLADLVIQGHPEAELQWLSDVEWRFSGIALMEGTNQLTVVGRDSFGRAVKQSGELFVKEGNGPPRVRFLPDGPYWKTAVEDDFEVDGRSSRDPEGGALAFRWEVTPSKGVLLQTNTPGRCVFKASFPGLYEVALECVDSQGKTGGFTNTVAVYGRRGLSRFDQHELEDYWTLQGVGYRGNQASGTWLSLSEPGNVLSLAIMEDAGRPLGLGSAAFPAVWRDLPAVGEWAFLTELAIANGADGDFETGLAVDLVESGKSIRYTVALTGAGEVVARRLDGSSVTGKIATETLRSNKVGLRARKQGSSLFLESTAAGSWGLLASVTLPAGVLAEKVGLFVARSDIKRVVSSFYHALLVDPSGSSALQESIRLTELMCTPPGGELFEFVELMNSGSTPADLSGARFTNGISFVFGAATLAAGERIVVAKDHQAFVSRYGDRGRSLASGTFSGKLDNAGERLTLVDAQSRVILDFSYGASGAWPGRAFGAGSSLELLDVNVNPSNPSSWRSSLDYLGSPGGPGTDAVMGVVINELLSNANPPFEKAIELFNNSETAVDVSGWFLSESAAKLKNYRIPDGTVVPRRGFSVLYEFQFGQTNAPASMRVDGTRKGDLWLVAADSLAQVTRFVDHVEFDAGALRVSSGRYPDGVGPWGHSLRAPSFGSPVLASDPAEKIEEFRKGTGAPNLPPVIGPLVVSRIMYHPLPGGDEFIEFANTSETALDLFDPLFPANRWRISKAIQFVFPRDVQLAPNQRLLVVGSDPSVFRAKNRVGEGALIFGPFEGGLNNGGESIEIGRPGTPVPGVDGSIFVPYLPVDRVRYGSAYPWPELADGRGMLLSRADLTASAESFADWRPEDPGFESDSDADGMLDRFEMLYGLNSLDPSDALFDADNDGFSNLEEYFAGTHPLIPSGRFEITSVAPSKNGIAIQFNAVRGRSYRILRSEKVVEGDWAVVAELTSNDQSGVLLVQDLPWAPQGSVFFRIVTP